MHIRFFYQVCKIELTRIIKLLKKSNVDTSKYGEELRCYIKNVDDRLNVISDLNFAIDAAFRENNIEIPFPQRDLHIKDGSGKGG